MLSRAQQREIGLKELNKRGVPFVVWPQDIKYWHNGGTVELPMLGFDRPRGYLLIGVILLSEFLEKVVEGGRYGMLDDTYFVGEYRRLK